MVPRDPVLSAHPTPRPTPAPLLANKRQFSGEFSSRADANNREFHNPLHGAGLLLDSKYIQNVTTPSSPNTDAKIDIGHE